MSSAAILLSALRVKMYHKWIIYKQENNWWSYNGNNGNCWKICETKCIWSSTHEKGPDAIRVQRRPWSTCAIAQVDLDRRCPPTESMDIVVYMSTSRECPDQTVRVHTLIWPHAVNIWHKGIFPCDASYAINYLVLITSVLSTSLGKTFFAWRFILNENILFWLTVSYQKPFVFSISVFCSQKYTLQFNLRPKIGLTNAIAIVKWFFGLFV